MQIYTLYLLAIACKFVVGSADQFDIVSLADSDVYQTAYDYRSIMHYDKSAFAKSRGLLTIVPKQAGFLDIIGQVSDASEIDMTKIKRIYGCDTVVTCKKSLYSYSFSFCKLRFYDLACVDTASLSICNTYKNFCNDANVLRSCRRSCGRC